MAEQGDGTIEVEEEEEFMSFEQLVPVTAGVVPYVIAWPTDLHPGTSKQCSWWFSKGQEV